MPQKKKNQIKRNTLAVRIVDEDYERFIELTGKEYSTVLRKLIKYYNRNQEIQREIAAG